MALARQQTIRRTYAGANLTVIDFDDIALLNGVGGSGRLLVIGVQGQVPDSVTYNGQAMIAGPLADAFTDGKGFWLFDAGLPNDTLQHTLSLTFGGPRSGISVLITEYSGVDQAASLEAQAAAASADPHTFDFTSTIDGVGTLLYYWRYENRAWEPSGVPSGVIFAADDGATTNAYSTRAHQITGPTPAGLNQYVWNPQGGSTYNVLGWQIPEAAGGGSAETIQPAIIASAAQVFAPNVQPGSVTLQPARIESTAQTFAPTVATGTAIVPSLIPSSAQVHAPTVSEGMAVAPALLASSVQVFAPTLQPGAVTLQPGLIPSAAQVYAPTVSEGTAADVVQPATITSSALVHTPTLQPGAATLAPTFLASSAAVYAPTVSEGVAVAPARIEATAQVFAPTVSEGTPADVITPALLGSAAAVFQPTLAPGAAAVAPGFMATAADVFSPALIEAVALLPAFIASTAALYSPAVGLGELVVPAKNVVPSVHRHRTADAVHRHRIAEST